MSEHDREERRLPPELFEKRLAELRAYYYEHGEDLPWGPEGPRGYEPEQYDVWWLLGEVVALREQLVAEREAHAGTETQRAKLESYLQMANNTSKRRGERRDELRALLDEVVRIAVDANLGIPQTHEEAVARLRAALVSRG